MYKHQDGQNLAELRNYKLVQGQLFKINGKNHYCGVAPYPVPAVKNDSWMELNPNNDFVEEWFWNGNYWLSKAKYQLGSMSFENFSGSSTFVRTGAEGVDALGFVDNNVFFDSLRAGFFYTGTQPANAYWYISLQTITNGSGLGGSVNIATVDTLNRPSSTWHTPRSNTGVHIDLVTNAANLTNSIKGFGILLAKNASAPAVTGWAVAMYRKARK